ncbi:glucokinase [Poseidonocella sedimentorum]|nr:glucokinase [Poseidonocella sedimentorum]
MIHPDNAYTLVADVGGTNTRVALADGAALVPGTIRRYRNAEFPGIESVLAQFLDDEGGADPAAACIAVAGPVHNGVAELTNLDWSIDGGALARSTRSETVAILNDLQAQGHALPYLTPEAQREVVPAGVEDSRGTTRLVIGVGTGFNAALVLTDAGKTIVPPSEAGHASLLVRNESEYRLSRYIESAHGLPGIEDVLSGRGLERVYQWLGQEDGDFRQQTAAEIMAHCADGTDPRAEDTVRHFVRILGAVAGNLSLIQLPFGGVYLVGGVARAMTPYLQPFGFADAFRDKGRFAGFMKNFAVHVVEDDYAALTGCAAHIASVIAAKS